MRNDFQNSKLIPRHSLLSLLSAGKIETQILAQQVKPVAGTSNASNGISGFLKIKGAGGHFCHTGLLIETLVEALAWRLN